MFLLLYCKEIAETIAIIRMAREAISSAAPQGLALTLGVRLMVVVVDVLMVRVGEGETDERITNENKYDIFTFRKLACLKTNLLIKKSNTHWPTYIYWRDKRFRNSSICKPNKSATIKTNIFSCCILPYNYYYWTSEINCEQAIAQGSRCIHYVLVCIISWATGF